MRACDVQDFRQVPVPQVRAFGTAREIFGHRLDTDFALIEGHPA